MYIGLKPDGARVGAAGSSAAAASSAIVAIALRILAATVATVGAAAAQPAAPPAAAHGPAATPNPTTILGPAALAPGTIDSACGTGPAGLAAWGTDRIEQSMKFTDTQRARFNDLKAASTKAVQYLHDSCPTNEPVTPTGRLEVMQQRLEAMLEAVRTVRPALDDFYATLNDEQKARLNVVTPVNDTVSESEPAMGGNHRHHVHRHWRFRLPFPF